MNGQETLAIKDCICGQELLKEVNAGRFLKMLVLRLIYIEDTVLYTKKENPWYFLLYLTIYILTSLYLTCQIHRRHVTDPLVAMDTGVNPDVLHIRIVADLHRLVTLVPVVTMLTHLTHRLVIITLFVIPDVSRIVI